MLKDFLSVAITLLSTKVDFAYLGLGSFKSWYVLIYGSVCIFY